MAQILEGGPRPKSPVLYGVLYRPFLNRWSRWNRLCRVSLRPDRSIPSIPSLADQFRIDGADGIHFGRVSVWTAPYIASSLYIPSVTDHSGKDGTDRIH